MNYPKWLKERLIFKPPKSTEPADVPRLDSIVYPPHKCEDCSRTITERVIDYKRLDTPVQHWKKTCNACHKSALPGTNCYLWDNIEYRKQLSLLNRTTNKD